MKKPKVSVIIPVYNGEKTLEKCLNSVLNQSFNDYEVLVVDNKSVDSSKKIILKCINKNKKVKYLFEKKKSRACARNLGIKNSLGKIIVMLDCDCFVDFFWLEKLVSPILILKENVVVGNYFSFNKNYWSKRVEKYDSLFKEKQRKGKYVFFLDTKNFAISKQALKNLKRKEEYFDSSIKNMEDFDFGLRVLQNFKIFYLEDSKVFHLDNDSFFKWSKKQFERGYYVFKIYKKYKKDNFILNNPMFDSLKLKNNLLFLPFLFFILVKNPKDFVFVLTSEVSWRAGLFFSFFKNLF